MKYVVMVTIPFGFDDTIEVEYSGTEHKTLWQADIEKIEALNDESDIVILSARVDERED